MDRQIPPLIALSVNACMIRLSKRLSVSDLDWNSNKAARQWICHAALLNCYRSIAQWWATSVRTQDLNVFMKSSSSFSA
jgi:hypothetical protein